MILSTEQSSDIIIVNKIDFSYFNLLKSGISSKVRKNHSHMSTEISATRDKLLQELFTAIYLSTYIT